MSVKNRKAGMLNIDELERLLSDDAKENMDYDCVKVLMCVCCAM